MVMINKRCWPHWISVYLHHIIYAAARNCSISVPRIKWEGYLLTSWLGIQNVVFRQQSIATDSLQIYKSKVYFYLTTCLSCLPNQAPSRYQTSESPHRQAGRQILGNWTSSLFILHCNAILYSQSNKDL